MKKLWGFITLAAAILCVYLIKERYGNIFYMSYAINSAERICSQKYDSKLNAVSYRFDKALGRYIVDVSDENGLSGAIIYTAEDGIENKYAEDYESVCRNIIRGRFQKLLNSVGTADINCNVSLKSINSGIIGEEGGSCETIYLDFGELNGKEEFAVKIIEAFEAIRKEEFEEISASCTCGNAKLEFSSEKGAVSLNSMDLCRRIAKKS